MRIDLRIAYFPHFFILRKKKIVKTGIFVRFRIAFILPRWHRSARTFLSFSFPRSPSLYRASLLFSVKESGTNWLTSTRMASVLRDDRGVTAVSGEIGGRE